MFLDYKGLKYLEMKKNFTEFYPVFYAPNDYQKYVSLISKSKNSFHNNDNYEYFNFVFVNFYNSMALDPCDVYKPI